MKLEIHFVIVVASIVFEYSKRVKRGVGGGGGARLHASQSLFIFNWLEFETFDAENFTYKKKRHIDENK